MTFGEKVLKLRKERGWSQQDLAEKIGTHGAIIGKYERNEINPSFEVAKKISDAFAVSLDYLGDASGQSLPVRDKEILQRIDNIERLPLPEKDRVYFLIDAVIRDAKTRQAYAAG